jgi:hypothetical protein
VQKRAPGTRFAPHAPQCPARMAAPQDGQKLPLDSVPQFAHFMILDNRPHGGARKEGSQRPAVCGTVCVRTGRSLSPRPLDGVC